jgi:hypothetical protein
MAGWLDVEALGVRMAKADVYLNEWSSYPEIKCNVWIPIYPSTSILPLENLCHQVAF